MLRAALMRFSFFEACRFRLFAEINDDSQHKIGRIDVSH